VPRARLLVTPEAFLHMLHGRTLGSTLLARGRGSSVQPRVDMQQQRAEAEFMLQVNAALLQLTGQLQDVQARQALLQRPVVFQPSSLLGSQESVDAVCGQVSRRRCLLPGS